MEPSGSNKTDQPAADDTPKSNAFYRHLTKPKKDARAGAKALVGKDDWLFLAHDSNAVIDQLLGRLPMKGPQLDQYKTVMVDRVKRFADLSIPYFFIAAPTKEIIYRDKLPDGFQISLDDIHFPMNQIMSAVRSDGFAIHPLHEDIHAARETYGDVYYRTDTHWNLTGGYVAYRSIVERIAAALPHLRPLDLQSFAMKPLIGYRGDLADKPKVLFIPGRQPELVVVADGEFSPDAYSETAMVLDARMSKLQTLPVEDHLKVSKTRETVVLGNGIASDPKIIVFHDSFMLNVIPYLSRHFSKSIYIWKPEPDMDIVEREKPDVVINVMLDRFMRIPPTK